MTNGNSNPPATTSVPQMMPTGAVTAVTTGTLIMDTYEIEKLINSGGMGEVYRGRNIHNGEPVAIKIVLPSLAHDPKIVALFQKESTVLSRLSHEAIVRYHTFTIDRSIGRPCMVMEFVSGLPLGDRVEQGPMPLDEVKVMFRRVASGLDKAHRAGVVHRDLSPDNVILEEGSVHHAKLIDFGIAKSASFGGGTLLGGQFAGKFNWVAPEQLGAFGGLVDGRSDIYSLALVVAAASRGRVVAMGDSIVDAVGKRAGVPDLTGVDPELLPLLTYMLQPDPAKRPESMAAVIAALDNPALVPVAAPVGMDPNRTVIGGALPVAPEIPGQVPSRAGAQSVAPLPLPSAPMPSAAPKAASDWAVPTAGSAAPAPVTSSPATIIAPSLQTNPPPLAAGTNPPVESEDVSPFGAPVGAGVRPAAAAPVTAAPAPKKSSSGMLVVVGLLVVVGGAAGAYFGGLFGGAAGPTEEQLLAQDAADAQAKAAADKAAADAAKVAADKVAADKVASDKAAADKAAADKAAADQAALDAQKQAEAARLASEATAAAEADAKAKADAAAAADAAKMAAAMTAEQQAAAQKAAEDAAEAARLAEAEASKLAAEQAAAQQAAAEAEAAIKAAEAAAAAEKLTAEQAAAQAAAEQASSDTTDLLAKQQAWLLATPTPACVHLRPAVGADPLTLDGYATSTEPLETLSRSLAAELKREADVAPRLINEAQCPVIEFAKARQSANVPALTVQRDVAGEAVKSGGKITLVVNGINNRPYMIFLFSDAGGATNLKPFAAQSSDGSASFTFTLSMAAGAPPAPQVVLVMATDAPLTKLDAVPNGVTAKSLMPFIEVALKDNTGPTALGMGFFRLEN